MIGWIILLIIIVLFLWLLISPLVLYVNSITGKYYLELWRIIRVRVVFDDAHLVFLKIRLFFIPFRLYPIKWMLKKQIKKKAKEEQEEKPKPEKKKTEKIKKAPGFSIVKRLLGTLLKSFSIRQLYINADTADYPVNAWLFPVASYLSERKKKVDLNVNFQGEYQVMLHVHFRMIVFVFYFIKSFIK